MPREFQQVGVIGLGTMGAGIAEVFARNGLDVVAAEVDDASRRARPRAPRGLDRSRGRAGQAVRGGPGGAARPGAVHHRPQRLRRRRPRRRGRARAPRSQARDLRPARQDLQAGRDPRDEHVVAVGHRDRCVHRASRQGRRDALLQPGAGHEAGRGHPQRRHRAGRGRRRRGVRPAARQDGRDRRRPRGLHRQRAAVRLPQSRGRAVRVEVRDARGHRRRDEARLRPADGSARAVRPDRPRHRLRDPRHDVQAEPRPAARAAADLQADDHRRAARP